MLTQSGKLMWIGNEYAAYPAYSVPVMNPEEILQMHDIPEDKSLSYSLREEWLPFSPEPPSEEAYGLEAMPVRIEVLGVSYQPFIMPRTNSVYYIDNRVFCAVCRLHNGKTIFFKTQHRNRSSADYGICGAYAFSGYIARRIKLGAGIYKLRYFNGRCKQ